MLSEKSSPRAGEAPRVPISLEGERRKAMKLIFRMEKNSEHFREKWLLDVTDENTDEWVEYINLVKNKSNKQYRNYKDFEKELIKLKNDQGYLGSRTATISQLQTVCERAKAFEDIYDLNYQRIDDALKHYMGKYCHSFVAELEDLDVECVREYENAINEWQAEIRGCLDDAEKAMCNINEMFDISFSEYVSSYAHAVRAMHMVLDSFLCVSDPFRSWVTADEGYVTKIRIEIGYLQRQKAVITEAARKNSFRIQETKAKGLQTSFKNKKLDEKVKGTVFNRQFCRKREFSVVDKIEMTENILHEKNLELDEAATKLLSRPLHTLVREPSDGMKDKTARLQHEVNRIEKQLNQMKRGKRELRETRYNLQKEYHKLKGTYESSIKQARHQAEIFNDQKQRVRKTEEDLKIVDRKIKALKRIIYVKNHPATVKKIFFDGYVPGEKIDFRDTLREAIDVAAQGVGKDWDKMYQKLPFNPPRNPLLRSQDLELLDMDFKSVHPPSEQMALRSLDKWTSLSKVTSVNALVRTLKTIKMLLKESRKSGNSCKLG
ncbi:uncharacterized protein LOC132736327 isoform X2 [Ruditapes philippinarum]|uniref:uncharacterized protein LOC132736327 isoform X2 n=1 Tax=Ruditapes philippinarum TaxID=129788 RepID=UPI00295BEDEE|nr:uncharacterized protein LOC132736327 isoform X2 [Ruditapes philippinarum]